MAGTGALGSWEELCATIDWAPDGCAFLIQHRVELGNVLSLQLALPQGFRLEHGHYPKPDADGFRRFHAAVRSVSEVEGGHRVGVQFLTDGVPPIGVHRLRPAVLLPAAAVLLALVSWVVSHSRAAHEPVPGTAAAEVQSARRMPVARTFAGAHGPWGELEYTRIMIEPPSRYLKQLLELADGPSARWVFRGRTMGQVSDLLQKAGVPQAQIAKLIRMHAKMTPDGAILLPPDDVVLGLSEEARAAIYQSLAGSQENKWQREPLLYYPQFVNEQLDFSVLKPEVQASFTNLVYRRSSWIGFSDPGALLRQLPSEESKLRLISMLHRKITYVASLKVDRQTNLDSVEAYWRFGQRQYDLRPLLESLARVPGGASLDLVHLLPPFARRRLYRYPDPADTGPVPPDCHFTSLNFFNEVPDARLADEAHQSEVFQQQFVRVDRPRFGDLVTLNDPHQGDGGAWPEQMVHSAVYLADELIFTKNGRDPSQPWLLMKLDAMLDRYQSVGGSNTPLKVVFYRRRD